MKGGVVVLGVDIGSGSCKASVAVVEKDANGGFNIRVLHNVEEELMLKFDLEVNGRITEPMEERLHNVLLGFKEEAERNYGAMQAIGVATAAMRAAPNGSEILQRLERVLSFNRYGAFGSWYLGGLQDFS
jgi:exopolyphosphatase/pppGpp-phosphohydrolase